MYQLSQWYNWLIKCASSAIRSSSWMRGGDEHPGSKDLTQGCGSVARQPSESEMTNGEQKILWRGVAAGTMVGLAVGLMIALVIAMRPDLVAGLIQ